MSLLHIGDVISMHSETKNGFLSTLGLVDDRCVVPYQKQDFSAIDPPKKFRDCLFKVCFQHKYDVQNELWRSNHIDEELYKKLYEAAKSEQESNQEKNHLKRGTVVKYEDTIQLLHLKSNKYMTVNTKAGAHEELDATRVYLDSSGNEGSWFKVKSPYKYRSIGEDVVCESIALVSDVVRGGTLCQEEPLYLHASSFHLVDNPECFEVNASHQSTSWIIKSFLDYTENLEDFLKGGDVVRLFHTDQEKFLTMDDYEGDETQHVFLRSTDRAKATSATSSKALWEVEVVHADPCRSSLARWNSLIRLKHLATERFLAADRDDDLTHDVMREKLRNKGAPVYKLISIEFSYDYATLFEFDSTTMNVNSDDYIPIHSNVTLKHHPTCTYVHSTSIYIDKDKKKSCMSKVGCAQNKGLDEVFAVIPVSATEVRDLDFVSDACVLLTELHDLIKENVDASRAIAHRKLIDLLAEIIHFIASQENEPRKIEKALLMTEIKNPNRERQKLLREQNVLKLIFDILELEDAVETNKNVCRFCYQVLRLSFQDYRKNQEYIVRYDKFMQKQFGKDIYAEFTYAALFNSNRNLLEKCVSHADVRVFIELLREKRDSSLLDCLTNLCITSDGSVSQKIQTLVCDTILFQSNDDILIQTHIIDNGPSKQISLSTKHWTGFDHSKKYALAQIQVKKTLHELEHGASKGCELDKFMLYYYRHQVDLFSALCVGRQHKAISVLSKRLPLDLIQHCIRDNKLHYELRAAFCKLLLHSHIIDGSRAVVPPVALKHTWNSIPETITIEEYSARAFTEPNAAFVEIMSFVEKYLTDLTTISSRSIFSDSQRNKLTFEMINLNRELTHFGFYKLSDFLRLSEMLLIVLEDEKNQHQLVMRTKTKIIETLQYMSDVRLDYMLINLLAIFKTNQQKKCSSTSQNNGSAPSSVAASSTARAINALTLATEVPSFDARNELSDNIRMATLTSSTASASHESANSTPNGLTSLSSHTALSAIRTERALDKHLGETNWDYSQGRKFINVLLHLVKHDCQELVSASLKLLLNYRSQRQRVLETFKNVELLDCSSDICDSFEKLHPLIERSDKYIRNASNETQAVVNEVLMQNTKLISYIVRHINYLIKNSDDTCLTRDLLHLLKDIIPADRAEDSSSHFLQLKAHQQTNQTISTLRNQQLKQTIQRVGTGSGINFGSNSKTRTKARQSCVDSSLHSLSLTEVQSRLDARGASNLIVDLIALCSMGAEEKVRLRSNALFKDSLTLAIGLLEGGNPLIQTSILEKLTRKSELDKSERFFEVLAMKLNLAQQSLSPNSSTLFTGDWALDSKLILRFLQLLCEDHNYAMQKYLYNQKNKTNCNLVATTLVFLNCICGSKEGSLGHKLGEYVKENNVSLINQTIRTLTEYCEGPCVENQRCILLHECNGIDMIRSLILDSIEPLYSLRMDLVLELKDNATKLLLALMESCSNSLHAARILREPSLTRKLINVAIAFYHEQADYDEIFSGLSSEEVPGNADGIVMPREVGHKVFILCHQLVQHYNMLSNLTSYAKIPTSEDAAYAANKYELLVDKEKYLREHEALQYYETHTAQIEIVRENRQIERVVFPVPQICEHLTKETRYDVLQNTEQDERGSKIPNFFQKVDDLFEEMKWQRELETKPILHNIASRISIWSNLEFRLSFLVTVLVLFCVSKQPSGDLNTTTPLVTNGFVTSHVANLTDPTANHQQEQANSDSINNNNLAQTADATILWLTTTMFAIVMSTYYLFESRIGYLGSICLVGLTFYLVGPCIALKLLGFVLQVVTVMHLLSVIINNGIINKQPRQIVFETDVLYHGGYLFVCTLGFVVNSLFYPFLLPPSLIRREETLRNVIKSVTKNYYSILMTGFLGLIIILLYTIVVYLFFGTDFVIELDDGSHYKPCLGTLWECYVAHVNYGLRDGGGIGERIRDIRSDSTLNVLRIFFIISYFLVVNLLILQLVYCIIVDSFATLRGEKHSKEEVLRNTCFVCGLHRTSFESHQVTFEEHIKSEHNLWHYLYFIVLIKIKKRTELNGPESFVYEMIRNKDVSCRVSWFPRKFNYC